MLCSHCEEHLWKMRSFNPDKRSIFSLEGEEEEGGEELCHAYSQQLGEGVTTPPAASPADGTTVTCSEQSVPETDSEDLCSKENGVASTGSDTVRDSEQLCAGEPQQGRGRSAMTSPSKTIPTAGRLASIRGTSSKTFVICGGNAAPL